MAEVEAFGRVDVDGLLIEVTGTPFSDGGLLQPYWCAKCHPHGGNFSDTMTLAAAREHVRRLHRTYPELDRLSEEVAADVIKMIAARAEKVTSEMPHKKLYVLERVVRLLEGRI
jgi:hypothetical protein